MTVTGTKQAFATRCLGKWLPNWKSGQSIERMHGAPEDVMLELLLKQWLFAQREQGGGLIQHVIE